MLEALRGFRRTGRGRGEDRVHGIGGRMRFWLGVQIEGDVTGGGEEARDAPLALTHALLIQG